MLYKQPGADFLISIQSSVNRQDIFHYNEPVYIVNPGRQLVQTEVMDVSIKAVSCRNSNSSIEPINPLSYKSLTFNWISVIQTLYNWKRWTQSKQI